MLAFATHFSRIALRDQTTAPPPGAAVFLFHPHTFFTFMQIKSTFIGVGSPIVDAIAHVDESFVAQIDGDKGGMVLVDAPTISALMERLSEAAVAAPGGSA